MSAKCSVFINCSKNFMEVKQIWLTSKEYLRDHRCEGTNMAYKPKKIVAVSKQFMGISMLYRYMGGYNFKCYWHIWRKEICLPNRE